MVEIHLQAKTPKTDSYYQSYNKNIGSFYGTTTITENGLKIVITDTKVGKAIEKALRELE